MADTVTAYGVMAYTMRPRGEQVLDARQHAVVLARVGLNGLCSYGPYGYGLCSYALRRYGL